MNKRIHPPHKTPSLMRIWTALCSCIAGCLHASWMGMNIPSRRMRRLLRVAAALSEAEEDESNLSFWAADAVIEPENDLSELHSPRNRFMRRVLTNRVKKSRWDQISDRARTLNSAHVLDHFVQVTGHSVQDLAWSLDANAPPNLEKGKRDRKALDADRRYSAFPESPIFPVSAVPQASSVSPASAVPQASPVSPAARKALGIDRVRTQTSGSAAQVNGRSQLGWSDRKALLRFQSVGSKVVVSSLGLYLVLILIGSWKPALDLEAVTRQLPEYSWLELGSRPRGRTVHTDVYVSRRYNKAVRVLRKANTSIFGYLPGFRTDVLNEGILELEGAIAYQKTTGYLFPQALILLADAYIRAGQPEKAIPLIDHVIVLNKKMASEARVLRSSLRDKGLY